MAALSRFAVRGVGFNWSGEGVSGILPPSVTVDGLTVQLTVDGLLNWSSLGDLEVAMLTDDLEVQLEIITRSSDTVCCSNVTLPRRSATSSFNYT